MTMKNPRNLFYRSRIATLPVLCFGIALFVASCGNDAGKPEADGESPSAPEKPATGEQEKPEPAATTSEKPNDGIEVGTLTLKHGDETAEIRSFEKMGTSLLFAGGTVSLHLAGPDGAKLSIGYQAKDGAPLPESSRCPAPRVPRLESALRH